MAANVIPLDAGWPKSMAPSASSQAVWIYVCGSSLGIYFAGESTILRAAVTAAMFIGLVLLKPAVRHAALLVLVVLVSPPFKQPDGPSMYDTFFDNIVPGISVSAFEVLLVFSVLLAMGNWRRLKIDRRFDRLLFAIGGLAAFGVIYGAFVKGNPLPQVLMEVRPFGVLILAYFGTRLCISDAAENGWLWEMLFVATLLKCFQGFYLYWRGIGFTYESSLRVFADAELLFILIVLIAGYVEQVHAIRFTRLVGLVIVAAFVLVSSSRFVWVAAILALATVVLFHGRHRVRMAILLGVFSLVGIGVAGAFMGPSQGLAQRFASIVDWNGEASNVARLIEAENALVTIRQQPILGTGLGGEWIVNQDLVLGEGQFRMSVFTNLTLVHNAYLWIWLKLGLPGIILLLMILVQSMRAAVRSIRACPTIDRKYAWGVFTGLMSFYLILMVGNWLLHLRCMAAWGLLLASPALGIANRATGKSRTNA